jgi:conjugal transfer pilus assembly protein TraK
MALAFTTASTVNAQDPPPVAAPLTLSVEDDRINLSPETAPPKPATAPPTRASEVDALQALGASVTGAQALIGLNQEVKPPPPELTVKPGKNEVLAIALGHLNRLVTPFANPVVKTTSDATTSIDGTIVYVATEEPRPITLYVMDAGAPDQAMSLTLIPRSILPVEVKLYLEGIKPGRPASNLDAVQWETSQPFVETIKSVFRSLAQGEVPPGYGLSDALAPSIALPRCAIPGVLLRPMQVLEGGTMTVVVARAVNDTIDPIEVNEAGCAAEGVLAVAAWPASFLEPGEETELYIALRTDRERGEAQARPSVLRSRSR